MQFDANAILMIAVIGLVSLGVIGFLWHYWHLRKDYEGLEQDNDGLRLAVHDLQFTLTKEKEFALERAALLEKAQEQLKDVFEAASARALERNNRCFLDLAKETLSHFQQKSDGDLHQRQQAIEHLIKPIQDSLGSVDKKLKDLETARESAYQVLRHQVGDLINAQKELRGETANLVKALRAPHVRGRWGEMQLRRVVEMSGMSNHCDFTEQVQLEGEQGALRPDMIINLPGGKKVIIDAKAPLAAYLDAIEAAEEGAKRSFMQDHARQVRKHVLQLAKREYWGSALKGDVPEFVVLFLPGETFFSAALEHDPALIELGVENRVILATPATLIAMLHAVAYGWRQEALSNNAREISELGKELYKRLSDLGKHFTKLGSDLNSAVNSFNKTVGTLERRVLPTARKFKTLESASMQVEIEEVGLVNHQTRPLHATELMPEAIPAALGDRKTA
jgi:DNA recombination protein RmuC